MSEKSLEACARRAARRAGLIATKWRGRLGTIDNYGGFMLIEPVSNCAIERFPFVTRRCDQNLSGA